MIEIFSLGIAVCRGFDRLHQNKRATLLSKCSQDHSADQLGPACVDPIEFLVGEYLHLAVMWMIPLPFRPDPSNSQCWSMFILFKLTSLVVIWKAFQILFSAEVPPMQ